MKASLVLISLILLVGCQKKIDKNLLTNPNEQANQNAQIRNQKKSSFQIKINGRDVTDSVISTIKDDNASRLYEKKLMLKAIYSANGNYKVIYDYSFIAYFIPLGSYISSKEAFLIHNNVDFINENSIQDINNVPLIPGDSYQVYAKWKYYGNAGFSGVIEVATNVIVPIKEPFPFYLNTRPLYRYFSNRYVDHFYTTNWNNARSGTSNFNWHGWEGNIFIGQVVPNVVPLYRYYNAAKTNHYYTKNFGALGNGALGYTYEGIEGYVYATAVPGSVPLYQYFNHSSVTHFYTTDYTELGSGGQGYTYIGIECYVLPSFPDDLRQLHAYHYYTPGIPGSTNRTDNYYTTNFRKLGSNTNGYSETLYGAGVDFIYEGVTGTVMNSQRQGSVPLYQYYHDKKDHFYTTDYFPSGINGYYFIKLECYVWPNQQPGTIPLYRYFNSVKEEHYYTTGFSELGNGSRDYVLERIECYIYP